MDNKEVFQHRKRNGNGVSLNGVTLAFFSAAVVIISFVILLNYLTGLADRQSKIEESVQTSLTEESAVTGLETDFRNSNISDLEDIPVYRNGNQHTDFQIDGISTVPSEELIWRSMDSEILSAVPAGNKIYVISGSESGLKINLLSGRYFEREEEVFLDEEWNGEPFSAAAAVCGVEPVLFLIRGIEESQTVTVISHQNAAESYRLNIPVSNQSSILSAGIFSGNPALLISEGTNIARMFIPGSLANLTVSSIPGTTPVFYGLNQLFGEIGNHYPEADQYTINSVVLDDFDGNGTDDLVFAGLRSICFVSEATGLSILDTIPSGRLVAWGSTGSEWLLSARWIVDDSHERWRTCTKNGFINSSGPEFFPFDWMGRLEYSSNVMIGSIDGFHVISDGNTGQYRTICESGNSVFCHLDDNGLDLVCCENESLRILMNPLEGDGLKLELKSVTYCEDDILLENMWDLLIFGTGSHRRIYCERTS